MDKSRPFPPNTFYNVADALIAADHETWNNAIDVCKATIHGLGDVRETTAGLSGAVSLCQETLKVRLGLSFPVAYTYALTIIQCRTEGNGYRCNTRAVKIEPMELLCEDCHVPIESGVACDACGGNEGDPCDDLTDEIGECTTCGRMTIGEKTLCHDCEEQDLIRMAELMTWPIEMHEKPIPSDLAVKVTEAFRESAQASVDEHIARGEPVCGEVDGVWRDAYMEGIENRKPIDGK